MKLTTLTLVLLLATSLLASERVLPVYVGSGATTTPVFINPTAEDVRFPDSTICEFGICSTRPGEVVPANGGKLVGRQVLPRRGEAGVYRVNVPAGLIVYSQIITGAGSLFRVEPLDPLEIARFYDVAQDGPYNGFLFVAVQKATVVTLFGQTRQLGDDEGAIFSTPPSGRFEVVSQLGAPKFYAFAGIHSQKSWSLQLILARP